MVKAVRGSLFRTWMGEQPNWECMFVHRNKGYFCQINVDDITIDWTEAEYGSHVEEMDEKR